VANKEAAAKASTEAKAAAKERSAAMKAAVMTSRVHQASTDSAVTKFNSIAVKDALKSQVGKSTVAHLERQLDHKLTNG
jgi:hypothetical protein